jgi:hypothetical protein
MAADKLPPCEPDARVAPVRAMLPFGPPAGWPSPMLADGTFNGLRVSRPGDAGSPPPGVARADPRVADRDAGACPDDSEV